MRRVPGPECCELNGIKGGCENNGVWLLLFAWRIIIEFIFIYIQTMKRVAAFGFHANVCAWAGEGAMVFQENALGRIGRMPTFQACPYWIAYFLQTISHDDIIVV